MIWFCPNLPNWKQFNRHTFFCKNVSSFDPSFLWHILQLYPFTCQQPRTISSLIHIYFGCIMLNKKPFTRYCGRYKNRRELLWTSQTWLAVWLSIVDMWGVTVISLLSIAAGKSSSTNLERTKEKQNKNTTLK